VSNPLHVGRLPLGEWYGGSQIMVVVVVVVVGGGGGDEGVK
jgi:hypothetical protein